jgi:protein phosphatase
LISPRLSQLLSLAEHVRGDADSARTVAERLLTLARDERDSCSDGVCVEGGVGFIEEPSTLIVVGDIHGDLDTLALIMGRTRMLERLEHRDHAVVFLGDYIDRGPAQIEVMALLVELKTLYGPRVILLRGNHEPPPGLTPYPHDFPLQLLSLYGEKGRKIYRLFYDAFQYMLYAATAWRKVLFLHGVCF